MDSSIKALHKNIAEWMAGPTGAVILHLALILAVLLLVDLSQEPGAPPPIEITYLEQELAPIEPPPPDLRPPPDYTELPPEMLQADPDLAAPEVPDVSDFVQSEPMSSTPVLDIPQIESAVILKNLVAGPMKDRIGDENRRKAGERFGERWGPFAELSVRRALEWLRVNQNSDGSWGDHDREALAGLGILTFLAHGETTASEQYGACVQRALRYLHTDVAYAHGRIRHHLQAARIQSLRQAAEGDAAAARRHARRAAHGGAAGVELEAGDARTPRGTAGRQCRRPGAGKGMRACGRCQQARPGLLQVAAPLHGDGRRRAVAAGQVALVFFEVVRVQLHAALGDGGGAALIGTHSE